MTKFIFLLFCFLPLAWLEAQQVAVVRGVLSDEQDNSPLAGALITVLSQDKELGSVQADSLGRYQISIPADELIALRYAFFGYQSLDRPGIRLKAGTVATINIRLSQGQDLEAVEIRPFEDKEIDAQRMGPDDFKVMVNLTGNLESVLQFMASGVTAGTGGELTSQYSVRGGNYDENLVYVNGFEIYRPLLIRAGQQEGLTFPNPDMLEQLSFSSGGFKAQYDDKMSSVLDVQYRRPKQTEMAFSGSLLGGSAYVGGAIYKDSTRRTLQRLSYGIGARYKTTRYLLNSLPIKGEYIPQFVDVQGNAVYDINSQWQWEVLGNYSNSIFRLQPRESATTTGLFNQALRLSSLFNGQEISNFENWTAGTALSYMPVNKQNQMRLRMRWLFWHYESQENERIDIENEYRLEEVQTGLGEDNFGDVIGTLAYGTTHLFARNFLKTKVTNAQWRGAWTAERYNPERNIRQSHFIQWGLTYKYEQINDQLKEWTRFDSLGYSLPFDTTTLFVPQYINTQANLRSHRFLGFIQNTWDWQNAAHHWRITAGVRAQYWTLNQEPLISPRLQVYYTPRRFSHLMSDSAHKTKELSFKFALGAYHQSPFYRELRDLDGNVNTQVKAQRSIHALTGLVWDFMMFRRRFKFVSEAYYKHQWRLIPYDVDNVRIRYYGDNLAKGYVAGLDFRLNGELVDGLESWVNLSFMRAREQFLGVDHRVRRQLGFVQDTSTGAVVAVIDTINLRDVPKPTDQFMILSMFFQDDFPGAPWCRVNMAFTVGTGFPFGIPTNNVEYRNVYRYNAYHRIDIGFMFMLWDRANYVKKHKAEWASERDFLQRADHRFRWLHSAWLSVEVFNLMGVGNVASNTWIKDFSNRNYAIPNLLTSRRLNLRFRVEF